MDIAGCEEDVEVVAMILADLCRVWPGAAAHMEVCRSAANNKLAATPSATLLPPSGKDADLDVLSFVEREETLLLLVADAVEADASTQDAFLHRWGVDAAWDYTRELCGRCWWTEAGYIAILPKEISAVVDYFLRRELANLWSLEDRRAPALGPLCKLAAVLHTALENAALEAALTHHLESTFSTQLVPQRLYEGAFHKAVVAVPPTVALFLSKLPSRLLQDCLLFHCHDRPLFPFNQRAIGMNAAKYGFGDRRPDTDEVPVVMPSACPNLFLPRASSRPSSCSPSSSAKVSQERCDTAIEESECLAALLHEYDVLLSNKGAVRVPLPPMSRYVFTLLLCQCELPSTLMAPFVHCHATSIAAGVDDEEEVKSGPGTSATESSSRNAFTGEEIVLGIKITWAVHRWTAALRPRQTRCSTTAEPSPLHLLWADAISRHSDSYIEWILRLMQSAEREIKELFAGNGESGTALDDTPGPLDARRNSTLYQLEKTLFAPLPLAFRGSTTAWIVKAVREVGEQHAQGPTSLMAAAEAELDDEHHMPFGEYVDAALPDAVSSCAVTEQVDSEASSDSAERDSNTPSEHKFDVEAAEALLAHRSELEAALHCETEHAASPPHARMRSQDGGGTDGATLSQGVHTWLATEDMTNLSRNELLLTHLQLLGAELGKRN
ncbi:hypothetical protein ABL78_0696 [Leptomonas seymouri]|uniref:Uncharacterized protein n=1 Tax=Leptomonas seymouri TaxID=5684 RepID=A0A0N1I8E3_LEPSE|nr:hypothetical protein ABL78_0696 [Leptomonas seymouri]|eukprot:KPI90178.1 hypothetical protein ABL78_0696 [Leptomonas seymouri]